MKKKCFLQAQIVKYVDTKVFLFLQNSVNLKTLQLYIILVHITVEFISKVDKSRKRER